MTELEKLSDKSIKKLQDLANEQQSGLLKLLGWKEKELDEALKAGWEPVHLLKAWMSGKRNWDHVKNMDPWSRRYIQEGHLWGDDPSETAQIVIKHFRANSGARIVEFGGGYGRDAEAYCNRGHKYIGIEQSKVGFDETDSRIQKHIRNEVASMQHGSFRTASLPQHFSDAVTAHRVLHLINPVHHQEVADKIHTTLIPGSGIAFLSARDPDDFNADQMILVDKDMNPIEDPGPDSRETAIYKDRPDHIVNFFGRLRFAKVFGHDFEFLHFYKGQEVESLSNRKGSNPVMTSFTLAVMRSKTDDEISRNGTTSFENLPEVELLPSMHQPLETEPA